MHISLESFDYTQKVLPPTRWECWGTKPEEGFREIICLYVFNGQRVGSSLERDLQSDVLCGLWQTGKILGSA